MPVSLTADDALDVTLRRTRLRACLLATHGLAGGLGRIQALLELRKIPFVGPSAQVAGLAYDKLRARQILAYHSLPVPTTLALGGAEPPSRHDIGMLGWPCVLKPRRGSHAAGVRLLADADAIADASAAARDDAGEFLLERAVIGREVQVVLLHGKVLGTMEVVREAGDLAQIRAMTCPPGLTRSQLKGIGNLAEHATRALGLVRGAARVDILVHPRHNEVILEAEPCPDLRRSGVVARVAHAAGLRYEALVQELLRGLVDLPERVTPEPTVRRAPAPMVEAPTVPLQ
ncbi:hypothetical protein [Nannocystis bainbridge]|uniref:ATP-grasp domain-containing protein n=1 Tax=Nannocystis bainbridge TaxID=2995303 RepID=A0ABT5E2Q9_9BACT|nr:hypothetical protein [Nannocystis bainbridge]MDC0720045.1 hypothetical protein [Nannocystis bainbridge]